MSRFPFFQQHDHMDCGPTCLRMISKYYGKDVSVAQLRRQSDTTREGSSLFGISSAAEKIGFRTLGVRVNFSKLASEAIFPLIVYWNEKHFVVVYKIKNNKVYIADPAYGLVIYTVREFLNSWIGKYANEETEEGIGLLLQPTPRFAEIEKEEKESNKG